jgi:hypothetical protein
VKAVESGGPEWTATLDAGQACQLRDALHECLNEAIAEAERQQEGET